MEIELKLLIAPGHVPAFRRHSLIRQFALGKPVSQQLVSTYYDTPGLFLQQHHATLRVRKQGRAWIQTLKGGGRVDAGLHQRHEWECAVKGRQPDLTSLLPLIDHHATQMLLEEPGLPAQLEEVFITSFRRTAWMLRLPHGAQVELALDQGFIQCGQHQDVISEIELELKSGEAGALFDFALALQQDIPVIGGNVSKAERGFLLRRPARERRSPKPWKAGPPDIDTQTSIVEGVQAIVRNCMDQIQHNEAGVIAGGDKTENTETTENTGSLECLHQMRIGLRRLQSCIDLFRRHVACPAPLRTQLADVNRSLGAARDWDVLAHVTIPGIVRRFPDETALAPVQQHAMAHARQHHRLAATMVRSVGFSRLMLMLAAWLHTLHAMQGGGIAAQPGSLRRFGRASILGHQRKLLKRTHGMPTTPKARHRLRIAVKKARYPMEFFGTYFKGRRVQRYLQKLISLQDALGLVTDVAAGTRMVRELAQEKEKSDGATGFIRGYLAAQGRRKEKKAAVLWKKFAAQKPPLE